METRRPYKSFRYARRGPLSASGKPNIVVGSPPEFKGEPGWGLRLGASSLRSSVKSAAEWAGNTIPVQIGRDGTRRFSSANSRKMRQTTAASASLILRLPRTGSPSLSVRFTTS